METNKLDNSIKEKFANRTLEPSVSAWERLSAQLDEQPQQKKKGWFFYIGYAASVLALISIGIYTFSNDKPVIDTNLIIVDGVIDTTAIQNNIQQHFNEISVDKAIVKSEAVEVKKEENVLVKKPVIAKKQKQSPLKKERQVIIAKVEEDSTTKPEPDVVQEKVIKKETLKPITNNRIKVNAEALLYAVTNTESVTDKQFEKQNINREDVLKTIKEELKKANLKVNPETILAEVERTIGDDDFQNNFLKSLKKNISNITTAITSRND